VGERCDNNLHVTRAGIVKFYLDDQSGNGLIGLPGPWPVQCRPTRGGHRLSHCRRAFGYATIALSIPGELRRIAGGCVERMATPRCRQRSVAPFTPALPLANPRREAGGAMRCRSVFARSRCVAAPDLQTPRPKPSIFAAVALSCGQPIPRQLLINRDRRQTLTVGLVPKAGGRISLSGFA
jgi:hypothetical protein